MMIKSLQVFCIIIFSTLFCFSQSPDTANVDGNLQLKRGFYKNYQEYLNNAPSISRDCKMRYITINGGYKIVGATLKFADSTNDTIDSLWGFCDGANVFVDASPSLNIFKKKYCKLQCTGKNPYFYHINGVKSLFSANPHPPITLENGTRVGYLVDNRLYESQLYICFLDDNGGYKSASKQNLKRLFAANPELLKRFKEEPYFTVVEQKEYLEEFNRGK